MASEQDSLTAPASLYVTMHAHEITHGIEQKINALAEITEFSTKSWRATDSIINASQKTYMSSFVILKVSSEKKLRSSTFLKV